MADIQMNDYYNQHRRQMDNYKNSAIPRPSEKMDSYFPPYFTIVSENNNLYDDHHQQPSRRTVPAARFKTISKSQKQQANKEFLPLYLTNPDTIVDPSASNLYKFSTKYEEDSKQPPSLHIHNSEPISQFSDDESSSEEEDEDDEHYDDVELTSRSSNQSSFEGSSSSSPFTTIRPASFTPPKPDHDVINQVANLMRSSSYRQRKAAVHIGQSSESRTMNKISLSDNEEERRGRQMNSHWLHVEENDENSLPTDHSHHTKKSVSMQRDQGSNTSIDNYEFKNDIHKIFKDLNGSRNSKRFERKPIPSQFSYASRSRHIRSYSHEDGL